MVPIPLTRRRNWDSVRKSMNLSLYKTQVLTVALLLVPCFYNREYGADNSVTLFSELCVYWKMTYKHALQMTVKIHDIVGYLWLRHYLS